MSNLSDQLGHLSTERSQPGLGHLDTLSSAQIVDIIAAADAGVPAAVAATASSIAQAVDIMVDRLSRGGRVIYAGAGTPGRLGVLDAAECEPTFGIAPGVIVALMAGGATAVTEAVEGAEDNRDGAYADLTEIGVGPNDVVVAISASGRTPYAVAALRVARDVGGATVSITNNLGSQLSESADVAIEVDTGPEVVAGSTRMKAGTAQKLVLNQLSTATMVRLGKTYGNLMVDVRATNDKLKVRAARIVTEATGASRAQADEALTNSGGEVKTAIIALLVGIDADEARTRLADAGGRVREALPDRQPPHSSTKEATP